MIEITKKLVKEKKLVGKKKQTMFGPAKSKKYADIVSIESPQAARKSVRELKKEYNSAKTKAKKLHIIRAANLAENRAYATQSKNLSYEEHLEMSKVSAIYHTFVSEYSKKYHKEFIQR